MKLFKILIPIYNGEVWVALKPELLTSSKIKTICNRYWQEDKENSRLAIKRFQEEFDPLMSYDSGLVMYRASLFIIVLDNWKNTTKQHGILAHEIRHVVDILLLNRGLILGENSYEAFTYLQGHLTEQVYKEVLKVNCEEKEIV